MTIADRETGTAETTCSEFNKEIPRRLRTGYCIRFKTALGCQSGFTLLSLSFKSWNRYKNEEYEEEYCHLCGIRSLRDDEKTRMRVMLAGAVKKFVKAALV